MVKGGGTRLMVKVLRCIDTVTPLVFYYLLFNDSYPTTILEVPKDLDLHATVLHG
jgi:hypothetical protein